METFCNLSFIFGVFPANCRDKLYLCCCYTVLYDITYRIRKKKRIILLISTPPGFKELHNYWQSYRKGCYNKITFYILYRLYELYNSFNRLYCNITVKVYIKSTLYNNTYLHKKIIINRKYHENIVLYK